MKKRFRLIRRNIRGGTFYCVDTQTGKRTSLGTANQDEAAELVHARNQASRQPILNTHIAKAYLAGSDAGITTRTWQEAIDIIIEMKHGANHERWKRAEKEKPFDLIRDKIIIETSADLLLRVLRVGTTSTNVFLRRIYNFCLDMNWLPWPIIPKNQAPLQGSGNSGRHASLLPLRVGRTCAESWLSGTVRARSSGTQFESSPSRIREKRPG